MHRFYANFRYQAQSWNKLRRFVAKVEWHPGPQPARHSGAGNAGAGRRSRGACGGPRRTAGARIARPPAEAALPSSSDCTLRRVVARRPPSVHAPRTLRRCPWLVRVHDRAHHCRFQTHRRQYRQPTFARNLDYGRPARDPDPAASDVAGRLGVRETALVVALGSCGVPQGSL